MLQRFIPACAGNNSRQQELGSGSTVHPRVCGEQTENRFNLIQGYGSSPRVRGTVTYRHMERRYERFIPACAGNRLLRNERTIQRSVHPRVCGEQLTYRLTTRKTGGSSPRVRGTVPDVLEFRVRGRFIPACAGNSPRRQIFDKIMTVHPRVCGEQRSTSSRTRFPVGSSPRVRGTGGPLLTDWRTARFIPACAGNRLDIPS